MLKQPGQEKFASKEIKEALVQRELAEIVPPLIRPILQEKLPEIANALETASSTPQEIELEVHNYRYLSIAMNPRLDESIRRKIAAELTVSLGGSLTVQGGKDSILIQDTPDFQRKLEYFVLSQHEQLMEVGIDQDITDNPFWIAVSNPEPVAHFKVLVYQRDTDSHPVASLVEDVDVTPNILVAAHMAEECMKRSPRLQEGELPIIISKPQLPPQHGWKGLRLEERYLKSKNQKHEFYVPQVDDDAFHNFSIEEAASAASPEEKQEWEDLVVAHWSDVFSALENNTHLTFGQLAERLTTTERSKSEIEFPESYIIELENSDVKGLVADIDVSGMTMIFKTLEKEIKDIVGTDMYANLQKGSKKLFSRWMNSAIQLLSEYGGYTSSIAGDGARCLLLGEKSREYSSDGEVVKLVAVEYLNLVINLSTSWNKVLTSVLEGSMSTEPSATNPSLIPSEWLAARFIEEAFGNRIFVKTSLAGSTNKLVLEKTETGGVVPFMKSDAEEEMQEIFSTIKAAYPSVSTHSTEQFVNDQIRIIGGLNEATVAKLIEEIQTAPGELKRALQNLLSSGIRLVAAERNNKPVYLLVETHTDLTVLLDLENKLNSEVRWYDPLEENQYKAWKDPKEISIS